MKKDIIKKLSIKLFLIVTIGLLFISDTYAFGNNGHFKKLKNVPLGAGIYYSPNEVFFPGGIVTDKKTKVYKNVSAKIYNINTQLTTNLNMTMNVPREGYAVANVDNDNILILGGYGADKGKVAEIYNKKANKFVRIADSNFSHSNINNIIYLNDNRILFVWGSNMEVFDPETKQFYIVGRKRKYKQEDYCTLNYYKFSVATKLDDGRIYIVGAMSRNFDENLKAEIYNPTTNVAIIADCPKQWLKPIVTLNNGRVLFVDGHIYDPKTNTVTKTGELNYKRELETVLPMSNNMAIVVGGQDFAPGIYCKQNFPMEIFDARNNKYKKLNKKIDGIFIQLIDMGNNSIFIPNYGEAHLYTYKNN